VRSQLAGQFSLSSNQFENRPAESTEEGTLNFSRVGRIGPSLKPETSRSLILIGYDCELVGVLQAQGKRAQGFSFSDPSRSL
jgi:hypothetical protein